MNEPKTYKETVITIRLARVLHRLKVLEMDTIYDIYLLQTHGINKRNDCKRRRASKNKI